jgi:hypothetical protein
MMQGMRNYAPNPAMTETIAPEFDHDDWEKAAAKRSHRTIKAPLVVVEAVRRAEMGPEQAALDEFMKRGPES